MLHHIAVILQVSQIYNYKAFSLLTLSATSFHEMLELYKNTMGITQNLKYTLFLIPLNTQ